MPARQRKKVDALNANGNSAFHELSLAFERTHRSKKDFFRERKEKRKNIYNIKRKKKKRKKRKKERKTTTTRNKQKNGELEPSRTNRLTSY